MVVDGTGGTTGAATVVLLTGSWSSWCTRCMVDVVGATVVVVGAVVVVEVVEAGRPW